MKKVLSLLAVCVLAIVAIVMSAIVYINKRPITNNVTSPIYTPGMESLNSWNYPEPPEEFAWEKVVPTVADLENSRIYADDRYGRDEKDYKWTYYEIPVTGVLYTNTTKDIDPLYQKVGIEGEKQFRKDMENLGWKESAIYQKYSLNSTMASGPSGSAYGYLKLIDKQIVTVVSSYNYKATSYEETKGELESKCPCEVVTKFFVSDPIALDKYLP